MRRFALITLPLILLAAPVLAEPSCKQAVAVPMWQVAKGFEEAGGTIQSLKVTNGCYEVYGHEKGEKVEVFFDPADGHEIERE